MKLLNSGNAKTRKGEKFGYITYGMHLAPHKLAGRNVCPSASAGCAAACLNTAGRGAMSNVQKARIAKTRFFFEDRPAFLAQLRKEIQSAIRSAERKNMKPCFRLNLTSDIAWEKIGIPQEFPEQTFYDYTKIYRRCWDDLPENYHITFSRSETNDGQVEELILDSAVNVAVVFRNSLPKKWKGRKVINGDETDLRFLDPHSSIVGLVEKGLAKKDETGFVIEA